MKYNEEVINLIKKWTTKKFDENSNIRDLGIDSIDMVEMIVEFEEKHNISIPSEKINEIKTIKDLIELVNSIS